MPDQPTPTPAQRIEAAIRAIAGDEPTFSLTNGRLKCRECDNVNAHNDDCPWAERDRRVRSALSTVRAALAEMQETHRAERARLIEKADLALAARDKNTSLLRNLLARIHGDGGQYASAVGLERASVDADRRILNDRQLLVALKAERARAVAAMEAMKKGTNRLSDQGLRYHESDRDNTIDLCVKILKGDADPLPEPDYMANWREFVKTEIENERQRIITGVEGYRNQCKDDEFDGAQTILLDKILAIIGPPQIP